MNNNREAISTLRPGVVEWLRPGEHQRAEQVLEEIKALGVTRFRTGFSWEDWYTEEGQQWFEWLIPKAATFFELLPCFTYTPPALDIEQKTSSPNRDPKAFADFIEVMIIKFGDYFEWVELWNPSNTLNDWDRRLNPQWDIYSTMVGIAAHWVRHRGKKTVLAGMAQQDLLWLDLMCQRGVVQHVDAVGVHGFYGTRDFDSEDWGTKLTHIREVLDQHHLTPEIWITETGYSTWHYDEFNQVKKFIAAVQAPADRIYWYCANDLPPNASPQDGFHEDERHYHFGLKDADGNEKLLNRIWRESGLGGLYDLAQIEAKRDDELNHAPGLRCEHPMSVVPTSPVRKPVLITGGAGFVGINVAARLLEQGEDVLIFDSLSRSGVERNLQWLCANYGQRVRVEIADIRDAQRVRDAVHQASRIFHFAAQVAVTTSIDTPLRDFSVNVQGTLNVLEALRQMSSPPPLLFTSTNKVYGALEHLRYFNDARRYVPESLAQRKGLNEQQPLDFHSPYGCSKGSADQYVLDYARTYGIPAVVFRMSCIYGPHQLGTEDQGWVAHFLIRALRGEPITVYGDGYQVRDVLYVDDLVNALLLAHQHMDRCTGQAFNIGGGPQNSLSLRELLEIIRDLTGETPRYHLRDWRLGDQKYYVSDTRHFGELTGWSPTTGIKKGTAQLYRWLVENLCPTRETTLASNTLLPRSFASWPAHATLP